MSLALLTALEKYAETWASTDPAKQSVDSMQQRKNAERFGEFIRTHPDCLLRTNLVGHLTGSALVTTPSLDHVLLTLHRKLGLWLQLGGHADGEPLLHEVALRECEEESGLQDARLFSYGSLFGLAPSAEPLIFDIDVHLIPARPQEPAHWHYDVRYLAYTETPDDIVISEESQDLKWFRLEDAYALTTEWAMHRQFDKLKYLRERLGRSH